MGGEAKGGARATCAHLGLVGPPILLLLMLCLRERRSRQDHRRAPCPLQTPIHRLVQRELQGRPHIRQVVPIQCDGSPPAHASISAWKTHDVAPTRVLEQVWVHVQGVSYPVRHFLGIWVVGSLIGTDRKSVV